MRRILSACVVTALASAAFAQEVRDVRVRSQTGAPIEEDAVRSFLGIAPGQDLSRAEVARDVKALEESGRFAFASAEIEEADGGVAVVYVVRPKPRIRLLRVDGAEEIGNRKVRDLLELGVGDLVDEPTLATKALKVREHYQKQLFPFAELDWTIREDSASATADVDIRVTEGRRASVKRIVFPGIRNVDERELRSVMQQKQRNVWLSWVTGWGTYKPEDLDADLEAIRRAYLDRGYLDARVGSPEIVPVSGKRVEVRIPVEEGPLYRFGAVRVQGAELFPVSDLLRSVTNRPGDVASQIAIDNAQQAIREFYGSRGYISTDVRSQLSPKAGQPVVDLDVNVREGSKAFIRDVVIRGNTRTKDKVIRREVIVYPGEIYNQTKVQTSERRLRNLGYFAFVNAVPEETGTEDVYDVVFDVEEQRTGNFVIGAGFSSIDDLVGFVELSEGNFDPLAWPPSGGGQKLRLRATAGTKRTDYEVSYVQPWFLDRRLSLGLDLFERNSRFFSDEYEQQNTGFNVTLGKGLGVFNRVNFIYGLERIRVYDVEEDASETIKAEEGTSLKSSFTVELVRDTRDSTFVPTRGARSSLAGTVAGGPFGADVDLYGLEARTSRFFPLWFDHVLNLRGSLATVEPAADADRVPLFDRLFLGGARTLRGFKFRDVGPKDEFGEPTGGLSSWLATAEYTIPLAKAFRFATFYDIGMVSEEEYTFEWSDYNSDWGVGVRIDIPGFPLRLDYAWPLEADEFNDRRSGRFQFTIGYAL